MKEIVILPADGERLLTEFDGEIVAEHLHRYSIAFGLCEGKMVLDIASGEGYGSHLLSKKAKKVIGVDISEEAIAHANAKYKRSNLEFMVGDCRKIPIPTKSIDLVVSFETIEHISEHESFMDEIVRVLKPEGTLIISSPNRTSYHGMDGAPNPFHKKELSHAELSDLINHYFKYTHIGHQKFTQYASMLSMGQAAPRLVQIYSGDFNNITTCTLADKAPYSLAIASNHAPLAIDSSIYELSEELSDKQWINRLKNTQNELQTQLHSTRQNYEYELSIIRKELEQRGHAIESLSAQINSLESRNQFLTQTQHDNEHELSIGRMELELRGNLIESLSQELNTARTSHDNILKTYSPYIEALKGLHLCNGKDQSQIQESTALPQQSSKTSHYQTTITSTTSGDKFLRITNDIQELLRRYKNTLSSTVLESFLWQKSFLGKINFRLRFCTNSISTNYNEHLRLTPSLKGKGCRLTISIQATHLVREAISKAWVQLGERHIPLQPQPEGFYAEFKTRRGLKLISVFIKTHTGHAFPIKRYLHIATNSRTQSNFSQKRDYSLTRTPRTRTTIPKVSVIVPNYNHSKYLCQRLESIYNQTFSDFEVILLDDASTDASSAILNDYKNRHPDRTRLVLSTTNSKSPFTQWAKGIELSRGEIIWIAESDDYCDLDFLDKLIPAFQDPAVMLSYCPSKFVDHKGDEVDFTYDNYVRSLSTTKWTKDYVTAAHEEVITGLGVQNTIPNASSALIRNPAGSELLRTTEWLRMRVCGDWVFYLSVIRGGKISFTRKTINYYRQHPQNTSSSSRLLPIYYQEHEIVACHLAELYDIPHEIRKAYCHRIEEQWNVTFKDHPQPDWKWQDYYSINRILEASGRRLPNVLVVCHDFHTGGGEMFAIRLATTLKRAGFAITFYDFNGGNGEELMRTALSYDIPVIKRDIHAPIPLDYFVDALNIEVINTHHSSCEWLFAQAMKLRAARGNRRIPRLVATLHGMHNLEEETLQKHHKILAEYVSHWVYVSDRNIEPLINQGLYNSICATKIPTGVFPFRSCGFTRSQLEIPSEAFIVCVATRAIPEKGWMDTISAVKQARVRTNRNIHLILIGEGPVYDEIMRCERPEFIHPLGFRENVTDYFSISDVSVLASSYRGESSPLCILESLTASCPVIATDRGEIKNMLTGPNGQMAGLIITESPDSNKASEIAEAIINLSEKGELYTTLKSNTLATVERFLMPNICKSYAKLFKAISPPTVSTS